MALQKPLQHTLKQQLDEERHQARITTPEQTDEVPPIPTWFEALQQSQDIAHNTQADALLHEVQTLLEQLPLVAKTQHPAAIENYFKQVVIALTKLYYIRIRLVQSDNALEAQRNEEKLVQEFKAAIIDIAQILHISYAS